MAAVQQEVCSSRPGQTGSTIYLLATLWALKAKHYLSLLRASGLCVLQESSIEVEQFYYFGQVPKDDIRFSVLQ